MTFLLMNIFKLLILMKRGQTHPFDMYVLRNWSQFGQILKSIRNLFHKYILSLILQNFM